MAFTFFMRDQPTLEHAADHMIPYASGRSRIKIWDAGCALGQETYTIAMIFAEKMNPFGFKNLRIDATDHDSANNFGDVVTAATYPTMNCNAPPQGCSPSISNRPREPGTPGSNRSSATGLAF